MMRKFLGVAAAFFVGLALFAASEASAQCNAAYVMNNIGGVWKVNNARGQGFGGYFSNKPQVSVQAVRGGAALDGQVYPVGNFAPQPNPNGGFWCAFSWGGEPARIAYASNRWWILEIGNYNDRNKIELIRR